MTRIRVLYSFGRDDAQANPFVHLLVAGLPGDVEPLFFDWKTALTGHIDIFHVHWPEALIRRGTPGAERLRALLLVLLLVRCGFTGVPIVRTVHNKSSHERSRTRSEEWATRLLDRQTDLSIVLNPATNAVGKSVPVVIPHGHYRDWFADHTLPETVPGRMTFFGLIRAYKNVPALLSAFRSDRSPRLSLSIVGWVSDPVLRAQIEQVAAGDDRVRLALRYANDADLVREVGESDLIVLPYTDMHNSGALFLALSLGRRVLVPSNPVTTDIRAEIGPGWIHLYSGDLTANALTSALDAARPSTPPSFFSSRDWDKIGEAHRVAYVSVRGSDVG